MLEVVKEKEMLRVTWLNLLGDGKRDYRMPRWATGVIRSANEFFGDYSLGVEVWLQKRGGFRTDVGIAYVDHRKIILYEQGCALFVEDRWGLYFDHVTGKNLSRTGEINEDHLRHVLAHELGHFYYTLVLGDTRYDSQSLEKDCDAFAQAITGCFDERFLTRYEVYKNP